MTTLLNEPLSLGEERVARSSGYRKALAAAVAMSLMGGMLLWSQASPTAQPLMDIAVGMRAQAQQIRGAEARVSATAMAALRANPSPLAAKTMINAARFATLDGARTGCRGNLQCVHAVGLFFGTQGGNTETAAGEIASATGLEAVDVGGLDDPSSLSGFDGLIVGAPTWHTGADEQRTGTAWDDFFETLKGMDFGGKPVAVFGVGDSVGYGDNFCDAIEELHSTFESAGAKMLGYTDSSNYEYFAESKSVKDGKFLGLPLDQDNEDDQTEARVKAWLDQIKGEGMPLA